MRSFSQVFRDEFAELLKWRRDVRHFKTDPIDPELLDRCMDAFRLAPSVGLSEPWRILRLVSAGAIQNAIDNFEAANAQALAGFSGDKAQRYSQLKLSGMRQAPVHLAIYCDEGTAKGSGLGVATMPEMRRYSVVAAMTQFWLAARAEGIGVGWVSILDPEALNRALKVPEGWALVGYLCVGYPEADHLTPELERKGWENRAKSLNILER